MMHNMEYWEAKEKEFETPDPQNPEYSMMEWDCFNFNGFGNPVPEERFRESVRKNMKTGMFEVYRRHWFKPGSWKMDPWDEIIYTSHSLKDAWEHAETDRDNILYGKKKYEKKKIIREREGYCKRCGRKLTDPESIRRGYGPKCWVKIQNEVMRW